MSTKVGTHQLTSWSFPASVVLITKTGTAEICSGDFGTLRTCWAPNISSRCAQRWGWSFSSNLAFKVTIFARDNMLRDTRRGQSSVALFPICLCTYFTGSPRHHVRGKCLLGPQLLNTVLVGLVACWEKNVSLRVQLVHYIEKLFTKYKNQGNRHRGDSGKGEPGEN